MKQKKKQNREENLKESYGTSVVRVWFIVYYTNYLIPFQGLISNVCRDIYPTRRFGQLIEFSQRKIFRVERTYMLRSAFMYIRIHGK